MKTSDDKNELFVVVDKNDKIIGYKTRGECHSNKNLMHRGAGVMIFNDKGEVLLQKRSRTKDLYPGYFTISSAGHVNKGESYEKTAKREMLEEIGIKTKITFYSKFLYEDEHETEMDTIYTATHNGPFKNDKNEVEYVQFIPKEKLLKMQKKLSPFAIKSFQELGWL
ncbi:MAG: NUDIX domain-containing protein [Candidatus Curtissbacteria bacterium]|nr:NUDIX domain-containing protein [Candidatus Curtissbacteria bacterium]